MAERQRERAKEVDNQVDREKLDGRKLRNECVY